MREVGRSSSPQSHLDIRAALNVTLDDVTRIVRHAHGAPIVPGQLQNLVFGAEHLPQLRPRQLLSRPTTRDALCFRDRTGEEAVLPLTVLLRQAFPSPTAGTPLRIEQLLFGARERVV